MSSEPGSPEVEPEGEGSSEKTGLLGDSPTQERTGLLGEPEPTSEKTGLLGDASSNSEKTGLLEADDSTARVKTPLELAEGVLLKKSQAVRGRTIGEGRYHLVSIMGKGEFGRVYRARDTQEEGRVWAVKEVAFRDPDPLIPFFEEQQKSLSRFLHKIIVPRREVLFEYDRFFLVMECIDGLNLRDRLEETDSAQLDEKGVLELALQLTDALVYLHGQSTPIIVGDLNPSHLMLTNVGELKYLDFGLSNVRRPVSTNTGVRGYAAPEKHKGLDYDERADIYSLGVIMHHFVSGLDPLKMWGDLPRVTESMPDIDPDLADIISRATEIDPAARYPSARVLRSQLAKLLGKWSLARPKARGLLVEWSGLEPPPEPEAPPVPEPEEEEVVPEVDEELNDYLLDLPPPRPDAMSTQRKEVLRFYLVTGTLAFAVIYLGRNGLDAADFLLYQTILLPAILWWVNR